MLNSLIISNRIFSSDNIDDGILECINDMIDGKYDFPLVESTESIDILNKYEILIEAADIINNINKDLSNISKENDEEKKEKLFTKLLDSVKSVIKWWYKIEPNKKYKTLHTILKILSKFLLIVFTFYCPGSGAIASNVAVRLPSHVGYEGGSKLLRFLIGKKPVAKMIVQSCYAVIGTSLSKIQDNIKLKVNINDIEKSIDEYDKTIDMINDMIEKADDPEIKSSLEKSKKDIESALASLIKMRDKIKKSKE